MPEQKAYPAVSLAGYILGIQLRKMRGAEADDITDAELVDGVLYIKNASASFNGNTLEVK